MCTWLKEMWRSSATWRVIVTTACLYYMLLMGMSMYAIHEFGGYREAMSAKMKWEAENPNCTGLETWSDGIDMIF